MVVKKLKFEQVWKLLLERQEREIEEFDLEFTAMGFNALAITETSAEPHGSTLFDEVVGVADSDAASVSGRLILLAHSNSATFFTHTAFKLCRTQNSLFGTF